MRSPLTETFKRVTGMIDHVRENLDDQEYDLFCDLLVPEPEPQVEKPKPRKPKKILHCDACDYTKRHQVHKDSSRLDYHEFQLAKSATKSKRASGMAAAISESLQRGKEAKVESDDDDDNNTTCATCGLAPDANVHHLESAAGYHEFDSGKSHALAAGEGV